MKTLALAALAAASLLGAAGCEATLFPTEPVVAFRGGVVARVSAAPPDIRWAPRVAFGDGYAYLIDGNWYQWTPSGWFVYRREPEELSRQRTRIYASPPRRPPPPAFGFPPR